MEILSYKSLNEQPLNQANLKALVNINRQNSANITRVSAANAYRNLIFSFVNRNIYNRYVNLSFNTYPTRFVLATVNYNFLTIYENNSCYFYPYVNQDVVKLNQDEVRTYLKVDLFDRIDPTKPVNIKNYFSTFQRDTSRLNKANVFVFKLTIGPKFDEINQKYGIRNQAVLKLPSIARRPNTYYVSFDGVSSEFKVDDRYNRSQSQTNKITPKLQFNLTSQQSVAIQNYVRQLNTGFNGQNEFTIQELKTSSLQLANPPQNLYQDFKFYTIFTGNNNKKVYLFTRDKFSDYFRQINIDKDCYILNNRQFIQSKVKVISI